MSTAEPMPAEARANRFWATGLQDCLAAMRRGAMTSESLVRACLETIEALNPRLNAFVHVDAEGALAKARECDRDAAEGRSRGALHGIPVAVKDIIDVAGMPTTCGSALFLERVAAWDAQCVARLREAGAIILGKTAMHEFAYGITGDLSAHGPSRNPVDLRRMSGGSSGGSAVAVAAGMVPLALGTDTVGSVRVPAALCGTVGFKPAFGAIPVEGSHALAESLDHIGLFAATMADLQMAYAVVAGWTASPPPLDALRVGWIDPAVLGPADPAVSDRVRLCVSEATCGMQDVDFAQALPVGWTMRELVSVLQGPQAYEEHEADLRDNADLINAEVRARLFAGADVPAWRYVRAVHARKAFRVAVQSLFDRFDLLALPTTPMTAPLLLEREPTVGGQTVEVRSSLLSLTSPWNLTGMPALSVPAGNVGGLPVGAQLVCNFGNESALFDFGATVMRSGRRLG